MPPIFFPDIAVGAQLSAGGEAQICFAGLSVAFSDIFGTASARASADAFAQRWVDALQDTGPDILDAMCTFADAKNLTPDGLVAR
ncbi:MAG: hypothetical protein IH897_15075 [Planctomycetes bacterium]|nr:hypothetical protein [Planctomycetota bacterium]